ncbi:phage virion morphogenesis protein [Wohlfahrtiimonas larvae]|uniref:Phage virion morphogenesis protein n=1 Tax=Wohlfahrtiimonas larvae TaxID=1157986 RepID=A0ABP9MMC5_9GAMM
MRADLEPLNDLIKALSPVERKKLAKKLGMQIRKNAGQRIKKNVDPDGNAFKARKPQKYAMKKGRMFKKLSQLRRMKINATSNSVTVRYKNGLDSYIAGVHQRGESARINKDSRVKHKYAVRQLFGINDKDTGEMATTITDHLGF